MSIQLTDDVRKRLESRAAQTGFASLHSYVEAMLRADAAGGPLVDTEHLEPLLLGRLDGPFVDADEADFQAMRAKLQARLKPGEEPRP